MFEKLKANILFDSLLKRPDIEKAYKMVDENDSWCDTITTVHKSLELIKKLDHEELSIKSHDDLNLKAIYYPATSNDTVIWVHGYTSHAERESAFPGLFYHDLGYNVLIPYLRAHGLSEGKYITFGGLECLDIMGWIDKINQINPNGKIIIHGLSMGGGIVLDLASRNLKNVKCLISDAPSGSIEAFFRNVSKEVFKKNSNKIADYMIERYKKEFGLDVKDFEVIEHVKQSKYPILLSCGSNENLEEFFNNLSNANPKETEVIILPGCNHGNGMYKQTKLYQSVIKEFIGRY